MSTYDVAAMTVVMVSVGLLLGLEFSMVDAVKLYKI